MKRTAAALFSALFVLFSFPSLSCAAQSRGLSVVTDSASGIETFGNYYALIIGIDAYREWNPLQTAVKDATGLRDILVARYGFDKEHVVLLVDEEASRSRITMALRNLVAGLGKTDNLLIYYAGHGQIDDLSGDGYWIPAEGKLKDPSTWVAHSMVKNLLSSDSVRAKNIILVADACYSGTLLREGPSMLSIDRSDYANKLRAAAAKPSRQVITSGGMEPVADGGRDGHSLFAYYFLKALKDNDREVIDLENLFHTRVWGPVTQVGDQRPNVGRLKTPMDEDGQFVLTNLARASQIAAVKQAEAEQAVQQQSQLAALMAEKERIEAELKRLELEKQVMEEKRKLEAERRNLEQQKRQLEAERLEIEQKRAASEKAVSSASAVPPAEGPAPAMQVASISPSVRDAGKLSLAILPWKVATPTRYFTNTAYIKTVEDAFAPHRQVEVKYIFKPSASSKPGASGLGLSDEESDGLWRKKSFISTAEPDVDRIFQYAERIGADLAVTCLVSSKEIGVQYREYFLDVRNRKVFSKEGNDPSWFGFKGAMASGWNDLFNEYLDARQEENRLQSGQKPREPEKKTAVQPQKDAPALPAGSSATIVAAVSPAAGRSGKMSLAVFDWKIGARSRAFTDGAYLQSVEEALATHLQVELKYAYNPSAASQEGVSGLGLSDEESGGIWQQKSVFSSAEPDLDKIFQCAERIGADLAVTSMVSSLDMGIKFRQYLLDVRSRKVFFREGKDPSWQGFRGVFALSWRNLFEEYLDSLR